jgi:hypothetical protein
MNAATIGSRRRISSQRSRRRGLLIGTDPHALARLSLEACRHIEVLHAWDQLPVFEPLAFDGDLAAGHLIRSQSTECRNSRKLRRGHPNGTQIRAHAQQRVEHGTIRTATSCGRRSSYPLE